MLILYGLDARTVSMTALDIKTGVQQTVLWKIDVTYMGAKIEISPSFIFSMGIHISELGGVHSNSLWEPRTELVEVSHIPVIGT